MVTIITCCFIYLCIGWIVEKYCHFLYFVPYCQPESEVDELLPGYKEKLKDFQFIVFLLWPIQLVFFTLCCILVLVIILLRSIK